MDCQSWGHVTEQERGSHEETKGVGQVRVGERARDIGHGCVPSPSLGPTLPHPFLTYKNGQQDDVPWEPASEGKKTVIK